MAQRSHDDDPADAGRGVSAHRLVDLPPGRRRRVLAGAVLRFILTFAAVITAYYLIPLDERAVGAETVVRLLIAAVMVVAIVIWQIHQIVRSELPALRAVQGVALALPFFLCSYATTYVAMSDFSVDSFSEKLNRTGALYFTIVMFGTVGFGDITPRSDAARIVVGTQVLLDLLFIAVVFRLFFAASRSRLGRGSSVPPQRRISGDDPG